MVENEEFLVAGAEWFVRQGFVSDLRDPRTGEEYEFATGETLTFRERSGGKFVFTTVSGHAKCCDAMELEAEFRPMTAAAREELARNRAEAEARRTEAALLAERRSAGVCVTCGGDRTFFDKLLGRQACASCR